jgi:hypothetical protein
VHRKEKNVLLKISLKGDVRLEEANIVVCSVISALALI